MQPDLSIIFAVTRPWEEARACLRCLLPQLAPANAEVIVGVAHPEIPPDLPAEFPQVQFLHHPGESVFRLRNRGLLAARASIVAFTEDHCLPAPDWCRRILDAHRNHPEAAAIGGTVANGPTRNPIVDWANYLIVFGPYISPIRSGAAENISLQANASYKRDVLPESLGPNGMMLMHINRALLAAGRVLRAEDGIRVSHVQSHGRLGTFAAHFHNGRSIATIRMESLTPVGRLLRIGSCLILPAYLFYYVSRNVAAKPPVWGRFLTSIPVIAGLNFAHALGELAGYTLGPGTSMESVR